MLSVVGQPPIGMCSVLVYYSLFCERTVSFISVLNINYVPTALVFKELNLEKHLKHRNKSRQLASLRSSVLNDISL